MTRTTRDRLTTGEAARLSGFSTQSVIRWCQRGLLAHHCLPGTRHRRIVAADLAAFLRAHGVPVTAELEALAAPAPAAVPA